MKPRWFKKFRPYQYEAIAAIRMAFASGARLVAMNAPTGAGKSLIAVMSLPSNPDCIVACSTKQLQSQYAKSFNIPMVMGKQNYRCGRFMVTVDISPCGQGRPEPGCSCRYFEIRRACEVAPIACVNHALLAVEHFHHRRIIIDEAHKFGDNVISALTVLLSLNDLQFVGYPKQSREWKLQAATTAAKMRNMSSDAISSANWARIERSLLSLPEDFIIHRVNDTYALIPANAHLPINKMLSGKSVLAMSATISRSLLREEWGIEPDVYLEIPSPIQASRRPIFVIPIVSLRKESDISDWQRIVEFIAMVARQKAGRGLIHVTSIGQVHIVKSLICSYDDELSKRVIAAYGDSRAEALERYKTTPGSILLSPSFREGLDLAGDLGVWQVIAKVPWPDWAAPLVAQMSPQQYGAKAASSVIQACGRTTRKEDDFSTTYIPDASMLYLLDEHIDSFPRWFLESVRVLEREPFTRQARAVSEKINKHLRR